MKKIAIYFIVILFLIFIFVYFWFQLNKAISGCDKALSMVKSEKTKSVLLEWVKNNIEGDKLNMTDFVPSSGGTPGHYKIVKDFDWRALNLDANAKWQIGVLGEYDEDGLIDLDGIYSISFSGGFRSGILVKVSSSEIFGVEDIKGVTLREVSEDIAVYCSH